MSVTTSYDEIRIELKDKLKECTRLALQLQDENIWGYEQMKISYSDEMLEVLVLITKARKKI